MSTKDPFNFEPLDEEERELIASIENGPIVPLAPEEERKVRAMLQQAALNTQRKRKNINLRVNAEDLAKVKFKANLGGIPYQTLLSALVHQYANDQITLNL